MDTPVFEDKRARLYTNRVEYEVPTLFGHRWETRYLKDVYGIQKRSGSDVILMTPACTVQAIHLSSKKKALEFIDALNSIV